MTQRFELRFESTEDLVREVESNLRRGRTFLPGQLAPADRSPCVVAVRHPGTGTEVELSGEVVFAQSEGAYAGVGVDLVDTDLAQRLSELLAPVAREPWEVRSGSEEAVPEEAVPEEALPERATAEQATAERATAEQAESDFGDGATLEFELEEMETAVETDDAPAEGDSVRPSRGPDSRRGITVHERVRKLSAAARDKLARTGNLSERVALERAFGASVWDGLLENSQITGAEVARIAKNGTAPATLLGHIAGHAGWLAKPEVRRALLSNSRLPAGQVERILRALPASELRLVPAQAAYPPGIRAVARRLLQR